MQNHPQPETNLNIFKKVLYMFGCNPYELHLHKLVKDSDMKEDLKDSLNKYIREKYIMYNLWSLKNYASTFLSVGVLCFLSQVIKQIPSDKEQTTSDKEQSQNYCILLTSLSLVMWKVSSMLDKTNQFLEQEKEISEGFDSLVSEYENNLLGSGVEEVD